MHNTSSEYLSHFDNLLTRIKIRKRFSHLIFAGSVGLTFFIIFPLFLSDSFLRIGLSLTIVTLVFILTLFTQSYRNITNHNLAEFLNSQFDSLEHSTQLMLKPVVENQLEAIQKNKVIEQFESLYRCGKISQSLPSIPVKNSVLILVVGMMISPIVEMVSHVKYEKGRREQTVSSNNEQRTVNILSSIIEMSYPSYTGIARSTIKIENDEDYNLLVPEGTQVTWKIKLDLNVDLFWINNEEKNRFTRSGDFFVFTRKINDLGLYKIGFHQSNEINILSGVNSYGVIKDALPQIRIRQPNTTLIEIDKRDTLDLTIQSIINDDYGIAEVYMQASVAKGSGEAVKFRDKQFNLTLNEILEQKNNNLMKANYVAQLDFSQLDMEVGDEAYITLFAKDNKPEGRQGRSSTIIIRWLEDEIFETAIEGFQIRYVPEFFRSQRQIIIETEQLIADRNDLSVADFEETALDLGQSQQDLKEKYGQYLGDEVEGVIDFQAGIILDGYHGGEEIDHSHIEEKHLENAKKIGSTAKDNETNKNKGIHSEHSQSHSHEAESISHREELVDVDRKNGMAELIEKFTHNHGTTEVAPLSQVDPKTWMKRAVAEMWLAEKHLRLSQPEKALPYEYKAYEFLKLARQSDRIYVKRLGFEPPPVNEDKRLTGDLQEILDREINLTRQRDIENDSVLFEAGYYLLDKLQYSKKIDSQQKEQLKKLRTRLVKLSAERPALIEYGRLCEEVLNAYALKSSICLDCIQKLRYKLWQLVQEQPALLISKETPWLRDHSNAEKLRLNSKSTIGVKPNVQ